MQRKNIPVSLQDPNSSLLKQLIELASNEERLAHDKRQQRQILQQHEKVKEQEFQEDLSEINKLATEKQFANIAAYYKQYYEQSIKRSAQLEAESHQRKAATETTRVLTLAEFLDFQRAYVDDVIKRLENPITLDNGSTVTLREETKQAITTCLTQDAPVPLPEIVEKTLPQDHPVVLELKKEEAIEAASPQPSEVKVAQRDFNNKIQVARILAVQDIVEQDQGKQDQDKHVRAFNATNSLFPQHSFASFVQLLSPEEFLRVADALQQFLKLLSSPSSKITNINSYTHHYSFFPPRQVSGDVNAEPISFPIALIKRPEF